MDPSTSFPLLFPKFKHIPLHTWHSNSQAKTIEVYLMPKPKWLLDYFPCDSFNYLFLFPWKETTMALKSFRRRYCNMYASKPLMLHSRKWNSQLVITWKSRQGSMHSHVCLLAHCQKFSSGELEWEQTALSMSMCLLLHTRGVLLSFWFVFSVLCACKCGCVARGVWLLCTLP